MIKEESSSQDRRRFCSFLAAVVALATVTVAFLAWLGEPGGGAALEGEGGRELLAGIPQGGTSLPSEGTPVFPNLAERHVESDEVTVISETLAPPGTSTGFSI